MRIGAIARVMQAYARSRWLELQLRNRPAIEAHHARQLSRLCKRAAQDWPFYSAYADRPFAQWPVIEKATLLANFSAMNSAGLSAEEVRAALAQGKAELAGALIGQSTGTSGNRGFYVITEQERFVWLGTILAKALPDALWRRHRVALALPALSDLYQSATIGSRIALRFFDLAAGPENWADALETFAPDTIVAPPKVLRWLAENGRLRATRIFSSAEVLDPIDRAVIETITGQRLREIYMATEGLFGVGCAHGTLHLAQDVVHFEFLHPDPQSALVIPIVTDFTRRAQAMIRYRMNDLLELDPEPCACGSAFQAVKRIEGRCDDSFLIPDDNGQLCMVTPDVLRNALVDADPAIQDFRIVQTGPSAISIVLEAGLPVQADVRIHGAMTQALARRGLGADMVITRGITPDFTRKLRRVRREWCGPNQS